MFLNNILQINVVWSAYNFSVEDMFVQCFVSVQRILCDEQVNKWVTPTLTPTKKIFQKIDSSKA